MPGVTSTRVMSGVLAALVGATLALSGCSGEDGGDASAGDEQAKEAAGGTGEEAARPSAARPRLDARAVPGGRDIVYRGRIVVRVVDVAAAVNRAETMTGAAGGVVFAAETSGRAETDRPTSATMTLRVPPAEFRPMLRRLAGLGKRLSESQTAEDVTTEVVDTRSRLATQQRSVGRVRALLDRADTIGEVVQVEAELARREADLESLQAQLARLEDVTELATLEAEFVAASEKPDEQDLGFLAGVRGGWEAFVAIVLVGMTVLGALLPFLVTAGLLALPAWLVVRSRRARAGHPAERPAG